MASLYQIDERLKMLIETGIDIDTGQVVQTEEEFYTLYDEIQMDKEAKVENTVCFIKNIDSDIVAFKAEEKALATRRKALETFRERLAKSVDNSVKGLYRLEDNSIDMQGLNKYKFETPKMKLSYRKSETVNVVDVSKLPSDYIKVETKESPKKAEIKKAIKAGQEIDGAELVTNLNMQIK